MFSSCNQVKLGRMKIKKQWYRIFWLLPMTLQANEASAWGLVTHLYFAHSLLWAMPLLDPRLQQAIRKFPELVMAGACLPDLAIVSPAFRHTHLWENAHHLLNSSSNEEETAIAIGYASHLYVDVIAHNHFVPAYEAMWAEETLLTHIASEWAMDAHLAPLLETTPGDILEKYCEPLANFIAPHFGCPQKLASIAVKKLAQADRILRASRIPGLIYHLIRLLDGRVFKHFSYYIARTQTAIEDIGIMLNGNRPEWEAELSLLDKEQQISWRHKCLGDLHLLTPEPIGYFTSGAKSWYSTAG